MALLPDGERPRLKHRKVCPVGVKNCHARRYRTRELKRETTEDSFIHLQKRLFSFSGQDCCPLQLRPGRRSSLQRQRQVLAGVEGHLLPVRGEQMRAGDKEMVK